MSILAQALIFERYGARLNIDQIAEVMGITKPALYNQISSKTCRMKTYVEHGKRWADFRDVAQFLDEARETSEVP